MIHIVFTTVVANLQLKYSCVIFEKGTIMRKLSFKSTSQFCVYLMKALITKYWENIYIYKFVSLRSGFGDRNGVFLAVYNIYYVNI